MAIADTLKDRTEGARERVPSHPRVPPLTVQAILARRPPAVCTVDSGIDPLVALRLMVKCNVAALLVLDGDKVVGLFSEHEYCRAAAAEQAGATSLDALMTSCDISVSPEDSAQHCLRVFAERQLRYLPVAQGNRFIDVLSLEELLDALASHYRQIIKASELDQQVMFLRGTYSC